MKWVPYACVAAGAMLVVKAAVIIGTDGKEPGVTGVLYLGGLVLALAAAIGYGVSRRRGRRTLVAVGLSLLLAMWVMGLGDAVGPAFEAVLGDEAYVGDEGPVGLLGVVLLALGAWGGRSASTQPALA